MATQDNDPAMAAAGQSQSLESQLSQPPPQQPDLIEANAGCPAPPPPVVDIKDLLRRLWPSQPEQPPSADEIADAVAHFFTDRVDDVQTGALLMTLHFTGLDRDPQVLSQCARRMLKAAAQVDARLLRHVIQTRGLQQGSYQGGFVSHFSFFLPSPPNPTIQAWGAHTFADHMALPLL